MRAETGKTSGRADGRTGRVRAVSCNDVALSAIARNGGVDGPVGGTSRHQLSVSIQEAWGLRPPPVKGPKPNLALPDIVGAGVDIADAEGVGSVSMGRIAADLGVSAMSLYRYVGSKDELLDLMVDAAYGPAPQAGTDWREGLTRWAVAQHDRLRAHGWAAQLPMHELPATPNQIAWLESGLACLGRSGLQEWEKLSTVLMLGNMVRSHVALSTQVSVLAARVGSTPRHAVAGYGELLGELADPDLFPALHAAIDAHVFERETAVGSEFRYGLDRLLDGVQALSDQRAAADGGSPAA